MYAGLRIEEVTALTVEDLSFTRGAEEVRVAWGKGNKERLVPMGPKLRRSLRRYLKARDALVAAGGPRGEGMGSALPTFSSPRRARASWRGPYGGGSH